MTRTTYPTHHSAHTSNNSEGRLKHSCAAIHGSKETHRKLLTGFQRRWMLHQRDVERGSEEHAATECRQKSCYIKHRELVHCRAIQPTRLVNRHRSEVVAACCD